MAFGACPVTGIPWLEAVERLNRALLAHHEDHRTLWWIVCSMTSAAFGSPGSPTPK